MERLIDKLKEYLVPAMGREVKLHDIRVFLKIESGSKEDTNLRTHMSTTLVKEKIVKPSGRGDGVYKVLTPIKKITTMDDIGEEPIDFRFPRNYNEDESAFGLEDLIEVFPGDFILISGRSNYGKTVMALSLMGENMNLFNLPPNLMGSEYTASDGKLSPKFKRRIKRMDWANLVNEDGTLNFGLTPVGEDYEDYTEADCINIVDWISLNGDYFLVDGVMKKIKDRVGHGIFVGVIQKNKDAEYGEGGERTERYADVHMRIDAYGEGGRESLLTLGKIKSPKGRASGRTWAFEVIDYGANFYNIREVVMCRVCWGKGYVKSGNNHTRCNGCQGLKYIDKI